LTHGGAAGSGALLLLAAMTVPAPVAGQPQLPRPPTLALAPAGATPVLDVPFVPQSPALCGGAAVAMVLRYWGERGVYAEEFAPLVVENGAGIRTDDLALAVRQRGWQAVPFVGEPDIVQRHLERGAPVIALVEVEPGRYHYVVLVAWRAGHVLLHDPARGPLRELDESRFERAWQTTGRWAMLVLPDTATHAAPATTPRTASAVADTAAAVQPLHTDACSALLDDAARSAHAGKFDAAERALLDAGEHCDRAAVAVELAAVRFRQGRYADASELASAALAIRPAATAGWDLLASSRYLLDDADGALLAWNRIGRPRNDLTRIDGIRSTPFHVVSRAVGVPHGALVTGDALARARRRVDALPTVVRSRVDYRPVRGGDVEVHSAIVERPLLPLSFADLVAHGVRALADSRLRVDVANAFRAGEVWLVEWVWDRNRRFIELGFDAPDAFGAGGVWQLHVSDRVFTYRLPAETSPSGEVAPVHRETHRAATVGAGDWVFGAFHWQVSGSAEEWSDRGLYGGVLAALELRVWRDRIALRAARGAWWSADGNDAYHTLNLQAAVGSPRAATPAQWRVQSGIALASDGAPRGRWTGAGADFGVHVPLRAHRLIDGDGVTDGAMFGPRLVHGSVELRRWLPRIGPAQLGIAAFADAARVRPVANYVSSRTALDIGAGIRLRVPGASGAIRADAAFGVTDAATALSVGWSPW
jgi:predicted double-glycine peptidase